MRISSAIAFWARVNTNGPIIRHELGECWIWTGPKFARGYGHAFVEGENTGAHRVAWTTVHGPIEPGMVICHKCDNPPCVRPAHLFVGTLADNSRDMAAKGRSYMPIGQTNFNAKLSDETVRVIRELSNTENIESIARVYGVHGSTVARVVHRKSWKHVTGECTSPLPKIARKPKKERAPRPKKERKRLCGSSAPNARFTDADVLKIRELSRTHTGSAIAKMYNANHGNICRIIKGLSYTYLNGPREAALCGVHVSASSRSAVDSSSAGTNGGGKSSSERD